MTEPKDKAMKPFTVYKNKIYTLNPTPTDTKKWEEPNPGEVINIQRVNKDQWEMELKCCGCGLEHILSFKKVGKSLGLKMFRKE